MASDERSTDSGIEVRPVYTAADLKDWDPRRRLGEPGQFPYTRGVYPTMYRGRPWTMRQYSGFGTAEATNERWKLLLRIGDPLVGRLLAYDALEESFRTFRVNRDPECAACSIPKEQLAIAEYDELCMPHPIQPPEPPDRV